MQPFNQISSRDGYRASLYEQYLSVQAPEWAEQHLVRTWTAATIDSIRTWLPRSTQAACLDLGCGSGRVLQALTTLGYTDVRGVDISPEAVRIAQRLGLTVTLGDVKTYLQECDTQFDVVTAIDLVEHFRRDEVVELFSAVRSRLKENGHFVIQTPNALSPWVTSYLYGDITHEWVYTPRSVTACLRLAGFTYISTHEVRPHIHGPFSAIRWTAWKFLSYMCAAWDLIETGSPQSVYTRNMVVIAR